MHSPDNQNPPHIRDEDNRHYRIALKSWKEAPDGWLTKLTSTKGLELVNHESERSVVVRSSAPIIESVRAQLADNFYFEGVTNYGSADLSTLILTGDT